MGRILAAVDVCEELCLSGCAGGKKPVIAEQHKQQQIAKRLCTTEVQLYNIHMIFNTSPGNINLYP